MTPPSPPPSLAALIDEVRALRLALERLAPPAAAPPDLAAADAFLWHPAGRLAPVPVVATVALDMLVGVAPQLNLLRSNTERFTAGLPANNALLWGARGMGKSTAVKAVHRHVNAARPGALKLIEIHREDIGTLPDLMGHLRANPVRTVVFCDDLSFDAQDGSYKSLKAVLEGGIEGRPEHVLFYATSNRRHLLPRDMMENERATAIHPGEAVEEKVSLSDRFGLWIGFHACSQDDYLAMAARYATHFKIAWPAERLRQEALEWAATRGARSGRVAWQFAQDAAGRAALEG